MLIGTKVLQPIDTNDTIVVYVRQDAGLITRDMSLYRFSSSSQWLRS